MRIGELACRAGCDPPTIRYYEHEGVLSAPPRTPAGYRHYDGEHLEQLTFVLHCRSVGIPLAEIKTLSRYQCTPQVACAGVNDLLDHHIARVHQQIDAMRALECRLVALRQCCQEARTAGECGILQHLTTEARSGTCACHAGDG